MNERRLNHFLDEKQDEATYVMTSSFRIINNHALYHLITEYNKTTVVLYHQPEDQQRNNDFIDGFIADLAQTLAKVVSKVVIVKKKEEINPLIKGDLLLDKGYLREEKNLEQYLTNSAPHGVQTIETNVLVPVTVASNKEEYGARTIRTKINKLIDLFIDPVLVDYPISLGEKEALDMLEEFMEEKLPKYHLKNHPELKLTSGLSPYLKYGIISPLTIYQRCQEEETYDIEPFLEELIVRRELSYNFVYYNLNYDQFDSMTYGWAYQTMENHLFDDREYLYDVEDYINFKTHDPYFNAAMKEMVYLGRMHGYMRMYWCKKIIEWSRSYEEAYRIALYLNNYYFLDGNTPNGYTGVAWCFGKHDRAWTERNIFGKLRYMNANGLKRKFEIEKYIELVEREVNEYELSKT